MAQESVDLRIGKLLASFGLISPFDLETSVRTADHLQLPLGCVLVMRGCVSESTLLAAIRAQSLLKDRAISFDVASRAMVVVDAGGVELEEALRGLGHESAIKTGGNRLGLLMVESGLLSQAQLDQALSSSEATGLPLGRTLVATGTVSEGTLKVALDAQLALRAGRMTRAHALDKMRTAEMRIREIELTLSERGETPQRSHVRIGEFFTEAGILTACEVINAVHISLSNYKKIGQVLVDFGWLNEEQLAVALELQPRVNQKQLTRREASAVLRSMQQKQKTFEEALKEMLHERGDGNAVTLADLLNSSSLRQGWQSASLDQALYVDALVSDGSISVDQAVMAFKESSKTGGKGLIETVSKLRALPVR